jgi:uncharacterized protein YndB with AHSA1/START domain
MDPDIWKRILWRIHVNVPMEAAYTALSTAKGLSGWMPMEAALTDAGGEPLPPGTAGSPGDHFRFSWHIGHSEEGEFLEANGVDSVRFSFGQNTEVALSLEETDDGSVVVTMEQTHDRGDEMNLKMKMNYGAGWAFYLANLKSVLEGGLDLRDFSHDTEHMINY